MSRTAASPLCAAALLVLQACARGSAAPVSPSGPPRRLARESVPADDRLLLTGELAAARSVVLTVPETPSWIVQIRWMVPEGSHVKKGDRVVEFDNGAFALTLDDKRAAEDEALAELARYDAESSADASDKAYAVEERRIEVEKARVDAAIPVSLQPRKDWQEKQLALRKAQVELAKAKDDLRAFREVIRAETAIRRVKLENARRDIRIAEGAIQALTLTAPQDGTILFADYWRERRKLQVGDAVPAGSPVVRIPDLSEERVEAVLYDVDDGRLAVGARARCSIDAFPDRSVSGTVTEISPIAQQPVSDSLRRTFRVLVALDSTDPRWMRPGMSVKVDVPAAKKAEGVAARVLSAPPPAFTPPAGPVVAARRQTLVVGVELRGVLQSRNTDVLAAVPLPGIWEYKISMMAPEGKAVKKGEPILAFDTTDLEQKLGERQAEADATKKEVEKRLIDLNLQAKSTELKLAEAEARREKAAQKVAVPAELAKANELRQSRLDLELAQVEERFLREKLSSTRRARTAELQLLRIKEARAVTRVAELKDSIARLTLAAPRDGFVVYSTNWRDEKKKVGDTCWRGEKVMEIPDLTRMFARGEVDEVDGGRVAEGQPASLRLDAFPDVELKGRVVSVVRTVQRQSPKSPVKVLRLEVELERVDTLRMRPGMRGRGVVETERVAGTLAVPLDCVFASSKGPVVWRRSGFGAQAVPVVLGRRNERAVEILSGISAGDRVVRSAGQGSG